MKNRRGDQKRIGIINASFFRGEVTEIVTASFTTDGRFDLIDTNEVEFTDAMDFIDYIEGLHRANAYSAFVMDSYGVNEGVIVAMRNSGLPVISVEDMFLAIGAKIDCDTINATPNLYTPKPKDDSDTNEMTFVEPGRHTYKAIDKTGQRRPRMSVSMSLKGENVEVEAL